MLCDLNKWQDTANVLKMLEYYVFKAVEDFTRQKGKNIRFGLNTEKEEENKNFFILHKWHYAINSQRSYFISATELMICNDFLLTHNFLLLQESLILSSFHTDEPGSLYVVANRFYLHNRGPWLSSLENLLSLCQSAPAIVITPLNRRTRKTPTAKSARKIRQSDTLFSART